MGIITSAAIRVTMGIITLAAMQAFQAMEAPAALLAVVQALRVVVGVALQAAAGVAVLEDVERHTFHRETEGPGSSRKEHGQRNPPKKRQSTGAHYGQRRQEARQVVLRVI